MRELDIRTAFLIIGILYFLLPAIAWLVLEKQRSQQVALWCGGGVLLGVTSVLIGLQNVLPEWAGVSLSALFFHSANLMRIQSLRMDLGIPWKKRWIALALCTILLIFHGIHYGLGNTILRAQFTSLVGSVLIFYLARLAWQIGYKEQSNSAKWIARIYALASLAVAYRVVVLFGFSETGGLINEGISSYVIALILLVTSVVGHLGYVGLHLDRSTRRELQAAADLARDEETRRLGEQIAQLDRRRSLGEMSASLGHELNQPLTAILTNAQVARRGLQSNRLTLAQQAEFLENIIHNTQRASKIIDRIRCFISPTAARTEPVDLGKTVLEVVELVAEEIRSQNIRFVLPQPDVVLLVRADPIQISQIILNVVRNAIEALSQVAEREIRVEYVHADGRVILRIRDTGPGLKADAVAMIGTPFFTTKSTGLGVGLSISRAIAVQYGGTLNITNAKNGGALVELNLPALSGLP